MRKAFIASILLLLVMPISASIYYVDATGGLDTNDGTTTATSWRTLAKVAARSFSAGDSILLKRATVWHEQLTPSSSGSAGNPVTFGAYGTGANPKIDRSNLYTGWWEHNLRTNAGFENFTGAINDTVTDTFDAWSNVITDPTSDRILAVSDCHSGGVACNIYRGNANDAGAYIKTSLKVAPSMVYYFEFYYKKDATACLTVEIKDTATGTYLHPDGTWGSLAWFNADAKTTWTLWNRTFTSTSIAKNIEFRFFNYSQKGSHATGLGNCLIDDFYLIAGSTKSDGKIWGGYISGTARTFGLLKNGVRALSKPRKSTDDPLTVDDGYFFSKNSEAYFYWRQDSDKPTDLEVGARPYGIHIDSKHYIVIDGIDVYGPGGNPMANNKQHPGIMIDGTSDHIIVKNLSVSCTDSSGVFSGTASTNITYDHISAHDDGDTGIYMCGSGIIKNCKSYNNARVVTDTTGDRGGIGVTGGHDITITGNEVYTNGLNSQDTDFDISIDAPIGAITVTKNYIHNAIQGAIQFYGGGDGSEISYNIIDGFATGSATGARWGKFAGICMGDPTAGSPHIHVYNNIIANGGASTNYETAGLVVRYAGSDGLLVKNNIFYNNATRDILIDTSAVTTDSHFDYNDFYRTSYTNAWSWKGLNYSALADWQIASGQDAHSLTGNPRFVLPGSDYRLYVGSPCLDAGIDVSLTSDYAGTRVPQGSAPDIGAYEGAVPTPTSVVRHK